MNLHKLLRAVEIRVDEQIARLGRQGRESDAYFEALCAMSFVFTTIIEEMDDQGGEEIVLVEKLRAELAEWRSVFGHLGATPDDCGNAIFKKQKEDTDEIARLRRLVMDGAKLANLCNEIDCRIQHGADGAAHLSYILGELRRIVRVKMPEVRV